jgi:DNA helicase-2/ATP-dependent DNA helicase PcrA
MNDLFYSDLELIKNDERQYEAYNSLENTVIIAGPGSGKTRVLALKAVTLGKTQIEKPSGLAVISFSRESVRELKKRIKSYDYQPNSKDFIGTVHSFSLLHVIQPFARIFPQYGVKYPIRILPKKVAEEIYSGILDELKIEKKKDLPLTDINKHRSLSLIGRSAVQISSSELISRAATLFEERLKRTDFIDFIDIINIAAKIIHEQEYVRKVLQSKFPWLLIDEYQDLGKALHEMVLELFFNAGMKIYVVGDVNQSIYGFNGGYPDFLRELTTYDDITTVKLTNNYRSSQHIIDASLITLAPSPPVPEYIAMKEGIADFTFITCQEEMEEQYELVAKKVVPNLIAKGIPLNEIGIITNSNPQIQHLGTFLTNEKIPYYIVNWDFENSAVVVWLQDCAKWCCDKNKQSFDDLFKFWLKLLNIHNDTRRNLEIIHLKVVLFDILCEAISYIQTNLWLEFIFTQLDLKTTLQYSEIYPNEINNLDDLLNEATLFNLKNTTIDRFANLGFPENEVTLTTRHSSKGLEFEVVIMLGMEESHFPSYYHLGNPVALAEDQRLCYVCISRAKKACILIRSEVFTISTRNGPWRKQFSPSRYWVSLYEKFGNGFNLHRSNSF